MEWNNPLPLSSGRLQTHLNSLPPRHWFIKIALPHFSHCRSLACREYLVANSEVYVLSCTMKKNCLTLNFLIYREHLSFETFRQNLPDDSNQQTFWTEAISSRENLKYELILKATGLQSFLQHYKLVQECGLNSTSDSCKMQSPFIAWKVDRNVALWNITRVKAGL